MENNDLRTLLLVFCLSISFASYAQFDKYKTKATAVNDSDSSLALEPSQEEPPPTPPSSGAMQEPPEPIVSTDDGPTEPSDGTQQPPPPSAEAQEPPPPSPPPPPVPTKAQALRKDSFGRSSGGPQISIEGKKNNKYVNLNPETAFGPEVVTNFEFKNVALSELTEQMQKLTGINMIIDKPLKGNVTITAPKAITVGEAWKAYLTALNMNGYSLVKTGSFYKVVQIRDIRYTPTKIYTGNYTPDTESYVMRIISLKNISSTELARSFRSFMSRHGRIIPITQTNTIIAQDTGENINRLVRLIKFVDVPGHEESLQIIPIKFASAQEIAKLLDQILSGDGRRRRPPVRRRGRGRNQSQDISKIIAEPRTNSIIAMANADGSKQLKALIAKLDVESASSHGNQIHVYYLNHGNAETLSKTLSGLVSSAQSPAAKNQPPRRNIFSANTPNPSLFSGPVKITSDVDNNALVVTASPTDYLTIKSVIEKLDIPRDQVYVEGLIMETSVVKTRAFGTSIAGVYGTGVTQRAGFQAGDIVDLLSNPLGTPGAQGLGFGFADGRSIEFTPPGGGTPVSISSINGLIKVIAENTDANILATPQILALDNQEAVFEMTENIPIRRQSTGANQITNVTTEREKVGLTLKITPQINKVTRFITLKIDQKIEDFSQRELATSVANDGGIATTGRVAVTTVVVRDRDTIAMGGLMRDKENTTIHKVPLLGDVPILGWLFKNKTTNIEKVNLLLFLTPKILANYQRDSADTVKDLLNRRNYHLKDVQGEDNPFKTSVKGLYEKAEEQEKGPLYDEQETQKFRDNNEGPGIGEMGLDTPDYGKIMQEITTSSSSIGRR